jgi:hypothetical protein
LLGLISLLAVSVAGTWFALETTYQELGIRIVGFASGLDELAKKGAFVPGFESHNRATIEAAAFRHGLRVEQLELSEVQDRPTIELEARRQYGLSPEQLELMRLKVMANAERGIPSAPFADGLVPSWLRGGGPSSRLTLRATISTGFWLRARSRIHEQTISVPTRELPALFPAY